MSFEPDATVLGLGAGDSLRVTVQGQPQLSSPEDGATLDVDGAVHLPEVGAINLDGQSLTAARLTLEAAYEEFMHDPEVTIELLAAESKKFYVLGQIHEPGPQPMTKPMTALEALTHGGFFLNGADRKRIFLVRPHGSAIEVHRFNAATPDGTGLVQILPGDILFVRRRGTQRFQEEFLPLLQPWQIAVPAAAAAGVF